MKTITFNTKQVKHLNAILGSELHFMSKSSTTEKATIESLKGMIKALK